MQNHKTSSSSERTVQNASQDLIKSKFQEQNLGVFRKKNTFLTASMIFLQNRLIQNLKCEDLGSVKYKSESAIQTRSSSDLLIIEKFCRHKSKKYLIRLKDIERYDEILRKEACIPPKALTLGNILPLPKKHNSAISKFFKTISSTNLSQISLLKKTNSFFRIKKPEISNKNSPGEADDRSLNAARCQKYIEQLPSENSLLSIDYTSSLKNTKSSVEAIPLKCNNGHQANVIYKMSTDQEKEISGNSPLRKTVSEDIMTKSKIEIENYKADVEPNLLKESESNLLTRCSGQTEITIKRQQSKLSVCDDYDWDYVE